MGEKLVDKMATMEKSITCLALELPESVYDDVRKKWDDLKHKIWECYLCYAENKEAPMTIQDKSYYDKHITCCSFDDAKFDDVEKQKEYDDKLRIYRNCCNNIQFYTEEQFNKLQLEVIDMKNEAERLKHKTN